MLTVLNRYQNKIKRMTDILEKLGVGGVVLGLFQGNQLGLLLGTALLILSVFFTREEAR